MRISAFLAAIVFGCPILTCVGQAGVSQGAEDHLLHLPGSKFLTGYPPQSLFLSHGSSTETLQSDPLRSSTLASMTATGDVVASARKSEYESDMFTAITRYRNGEWVNHSELLFRSGPVAISPSGSKLASIFHDAGKRKCQIRILELQTGAITNSPYLRCEPSGTLSWSPDSSHIAFSQTPETVNCGSQIAELSVFDIATSEVTELLLGHSPAWSPSGTTIAFIGYRPHSHAPDITQCVLDRCVEPGTDVVTLVNPNGSNIRTLMTFRSFVYGVAPVWSPDSKILLVNKSHDAEENSFDIYFIDLATGHSERKRKNTSPIYGWASDDADK